MFCPKCGNQLNDEAKFCTKCGFQVEDSQDNNLNDDNKLDTWKIVAIISAAVVFILLLIVILAKSCNSKNTSKTLISVTESAITAVDTTTTEATETTPVTTSAAQTTTEAPTTSVPKTTEASVDYSQFVGNYQAWTGGAHCPSMKITNEGDHIHIYIMWGAGASGYTDWEMNAKLEGNKLVYSDCICKNNTYSKTGEISSETKYTGISGYFLVEGGKLNGTGTKDFQEYVFEKP